MAPSGKYLPCKYEGLSLIPQDSCGNLGKVVCMPVIPQLGEGLVEGDTKESCRLAGEPASRICELWAR